MAMKGLVEERPIVNGCDELFWAYYPGSHIAFWGGAGEDMPEWSEGGLWTFLHDKILDRKDVMEEAVKRLRRSAPDIEWTEDRVLKETFANLIGCLLWACKWEEEHSNIVPYTLENRLAHEANKYPGQLRDNALKDLKEAVNHADSVCKRLWLTSALPDDKFDIFHKLTLEVGLVAVFEELRRKWPPFRDTWEKLSAKGIWERGEEPGDPGQLVACREEEDFRESVNAWVTFEQLLEQAKLTPMERETAKLLWQDDSPQWVAAELSRRGFDGITPHYASQLIHQGRKKLQKLVPPSF